MKNVTLKQLRVFAAVARTGSVTAAAEALHVSPPAITLQMKLLSDQVGLPLIERGAARMVPTHAGTLLAETVRQIEALLLDAAATMAALAGTETGNVHVGVVSTAKYFAPRVLAAFARAHPGIELSLTVGNRAEVMRGLREHAIDLAVMGRPPEDLEVAAAVIGDHPHVIVATPAHRLATAHAIAPAALSGETFLVREPGSGTRALMERFFAEAGLSPRIGMEISSNETIKQAVMAGLGIAFLSGHTIEIELQSRRLATLDVAGLPIVRQWHMVRLATRRLMPAADKVGQFFVQQGHLFLPFAGLSPVRADFTRAPAAV